MAGRKLSKSDYAALNKGRTITVIKPGGRTEIRVSKVRPKGRRP